MCVRNDRICDIVQQLYPSALCQIILLTKTDESRQIDPNTTWLHLDRDQMQPNSTGAGKRRFFGGGKNQPEVCIFCAFVIHIENILCKRNRLKRPFGRSGLVRGIYMPIRGRNHRLDDRHKNRKIRNHLVGQLTNSTGAYCIGANSTDVGSTGNVQQWCRFYE